MFYSQYILAKKGPLGTIWIAAHLERKLRKNQVHETNISTSVDSILFPEVPIALRLSGHLLLGVVRIYSRKVTYLYQDCNEALHKLKSAIAASASTPASINLPPEAVNAPFNEITLPETLEFNTTAADPPSFVFQDSSFHHVTSRDQITLEEPEQEDVTSHMEQEERFETTPHTINITEDFQTEPAIELQEDVLPPMNMDSMPAAPTAEAVEAVPDIEVLRSEDETVPDVEKLRSAPDVLEEDMHVFDKQDVLPPDAEPEPAPAVTPDDNQLAEDEQHLPTTPSARVDLSSPEQPSRGSDATPGFAVAETPASARGKRNSKKRKLVLDPHTTLSGSYMKDMLMDSSELRRVRRKVAHDNIWMFEKERLGKRLFSRPSVYGLSSKMEEVIEQTFKRQKTSTANVTFAATPTPKLPEKQPAVVTPLPDEPLTEKEAPQASPEQAPATPVATGVQESPQVRPQSPSTQSHHQTPNTVLQELETPGLDNVADAVPAGDSLPAFETNRTEPETQPLEDIPAVTDRDKTVPEPEPDSELVEQALSINPVDYGPPIESSVFNESMPESSRSQSEGWSVRTRAIAQVLRAKLEKTSNGVSVGGLLRGKTRKEAARMFFETLVLYTNDYISVEQRAPYEEMSIHSRPKLMKAVF